MAFQVNDHHHHHHEKALPPTTVKPCNHPHTARLTVILHPDVGNPDNSTKPLPHGLSVSQAINGIASLPRAVGAGGGSIMLNTTHFPTTDSDD